jgi:hypothetical protein
MKKWVTSKSGEDGVRDMAWRLDEDTQRPGLDNQVLLGLASLMLRNEGMPVAARAKAVCVPAEIVGKRRDSDLAFTFLIEEIKATKEPVIKAAAAEVIKGGISLNTKEKLGVCPRIPS